MSNSPKTRRWMRVAIPGVLLAAGVTPTLAQEPETSATEPAAAPAASTEQVVTMDSSTSISTQAQAVLDRMTASLQALDKYSVSADITRDEVLAFGYKLQNTESARMWVERPNRMRTEVSGDVKNRTYVYDGSKITMYVPDANVWSELPAPPTIGETVAKLLDAGVEMPLIDLLYHGATGNLTEAVKVGILVGDSTVGGVATDHLAFRQALIDWQLWVTKGPQALPVKIVITTRYEVGDPQYQAVLRWDTNARIDAKSFTFVPPSGATRIPYHGEAAATTGEAK